MNNEVKVEKRGVEEVKVKVMPADNVIRRIEKLQERGMNTEWVFKELEGIVNKELDYEMMEVIGSERGRNYKGEALWWIEIRLSERGDRLSDEDVEYMISWALGEYGKRVVDNRIGSFPNNLC